MERGLPRQGTQERENSLKEHFKSAALAVTNLYKTAAEGVSQEARKAGYDDALDDVMALLMEDGMNMERVRQWCLVRRRQMTADSSEEEASSSNRPASREQREATREGLFDNVTFSMGTNTTASRDGGTITADRRRRTKRKPVTQDFFDMDMSGKRRRRPNAN